MDEISVPCQSAGDKKRRSLAVYSTGRTSLVVLEDQARGNYISAVVVDPTEEISYNVKRTK